MFSRGFRVNNRRRWLFPASFNPPLCQLMLEHSVCRVFPQCEGKCAAADGQQAVIWTCGLPLASGDQMSTVRDHSSHCVYLRDSPPLQPSITPSFSLALFTSESLQATPPPHVLSSSSMLTSLLCLTFLTSWCSGNISNHKYNHKKLHMYFSAAHLWLKVCFICRIGWFLT